MREWARQLGVSTDRVMMLADGEGTYHFKLGERWLKSGSETSVSCSIPGLGVRALRYSMLVEGGVIKILNVEEPGGNRSGTRHGSSSISNPLGRHSV